MSYQVTGRARGLLFARADARNANEILNELQRTFAAFKKEHEDELADIKKNMTPDPLQAEKIEKINNELNLLTKALDETNAALAQARIGGGAGSDMTAEAREHAQAFDRFFRRGVENGLNDLAVKAKLTTQSDPDGGYVVPEEIDREITRVMGTMSVFRQLARVLNLSIPVYKRLVNMGGTTSGWVGEEESRSETSTPTLREIAIEAKEIYANPAITQLMLDDAYLDVAAWLAEEVSTEFNEQEASAFLLGNGVKQPRGLLTYDTVANASYTWGKIGTVNTGHATAFASSNPADAIIDLFFALKSGYRNGAAFLTSDAVMNSVRKFKDGQGNYLWAPPSGADMPSTILGKPVYTDDYMPALGANAFPMAFGNYQRAYTIIDRMGTRVLRDPYTNKPFVNFYTTARVGGGLTNFEAVKFLKCSE